MKVFCITKPGINFGFKFFLQYIATPPPFDVFRVLVNSSKSLIKNKLGIETSHISCTTITDTLPPDFSILSRNIFNSSNFDGRL